MAPAASRRQPRFTFCGATWQYCVAQRNCANPGTVRIVPTQVLYVLCDPGIMQPSGIIARWPRSRLAKRPVTLGVKRLSKGSGGHFFATFLLLPHSLTHGSTDIVSSLATIISPLATKTEQFV